jgi:hypothetical protein
MALLSVEIDNELSIDQATAVRTHLTSCPECARRSELLWDTRDAFRSLTNESAVGLRYATAAALAAATLAALLVGVALLRTPGTSRPPLGYDDAAIDCGVGGFSTCVVEPSPCSGGSGGCVVEAPPCSGGECAAPLVSSN